MNRATVIIVNWNGASFLSECLSALRCQSYSAFRTVVVDNGSTDRSAAMIRRDYPEVNLLQSPVNLGFAAGNNLALRRVSTEYAALLNNDAVPETDWLESLINVLDEDPSIGFAASRMVFYDRPDRIDRAGDEYTDAGVARMRGREGLARDFQSPCDVFGACGGAAVYRMRMLRDIGLFDPDFFLIYEDVDLAFRARLRGYRCRFVPRAVVRHHAGKSIHRDSKTSVYYGHRNVEWVFAKNMPVVLLPRTIFRHFIYVVLAFGFFSLRGRGIEYLIAKRDAVLGLPAVLRKRRAVQRARTTGADALFSLFSRERFFDRRIHRRTPV
jgi:hypothetical protein